MNTINLIEEIFNHMQWADTLIWSCVLKTPVATQDKAILETLHHIHLCQHAWLLIWQEKSVDSLAGQSFDILGLKQWAMDYYENLPKYLAILQEADLERPIQVPGVESVRQPTLRETFIQITTHSTYHRGQISKHLRKIGGEPLETDFIKWVFLGKPAADWN